MYEYFELEKKITKKTKAIVPVHFTGYMTNMPRLVRLAKKYNIPIIEDACQSILANINNKTARGEILGLFHYIHSKILTFGLTEA